MVCFRSGLRRTRSFAGQRLNDLSEAEARLMFRILDELHGPATRFD